MSSEDNQIAQYSLVVAPEWRQYYYDAMDWVHLTDQYEPILWDICIFAVSVVHTCHPQVAPEVFGRAVAEYVFRIKNIVCS